MKRYILVCVEAEEATELSPVTVNTDDIEAGVRFLLKEGYDLAAEIEDFNDDGYPESWTKASIDQIVNSLTQTKQWFGEDGARSIALVDTQKMDHMI